eukprot:GHVH01013102.1.p1 GENE.GHVH01013102.1~~GHVH01013102.1.p1  ORF type:complete len:230 (-),score=17.02 GHVH01013102.1:458-1147(-)
MDIHTDWSKAAVGIIVSIEGKPFLAATIKNTKLMASIPAPLGELIGIGLALLKFDFFVKNHKLRLHIDAQSAVKALTNLAEDGRESHYVRYIMVKGTDNPADCLSRIVCPFDLADIQQFSCHTAVHEPRVELLEPVSNTEEEGGEVISKDATLHVAYYLHAYAHFGLSRTKELRDKICPAISDQILDEAISKCRTCSFQQAVEVRSKSTRLKWLPKAKRQWLIDTAQLG